MRTLDEVIKAVENCDSAIDDCAYFSEDCENLRPLRADVLHYLKNYRDSKAWLELEKKNYAEAVDNCEKAEAKYTKAVLDMNRNDPLTWDELKCMVGKPVRVEYKNYASHWEIIENVGTLKWADGLFLETNASVLRKEDQGNTWQVYLEERE